MRTTIDRAGRLVIPKTLRDQVGLEAGAVDITVDGAGLLVQPVHDDVLVDRDDRLVVPASGQRIDDDLVRSIRDDLRR